jgi:ribosome maturation factor RimP
LTSTLQQQIEDTLSARMPEVEVVLAERASPHLVRVYIDRPGGTVDLELCERVSKELVRFRADAALEVSSPGTDRPLVKPEHYRRFVGEHVAVETAEPIDGRRRYRGPLTGADDEAIEIEQDGRPVRLRYADIRRARLSAR